MPFCTAMPKTAMNPTMAGTLKGNPEMRRKVVLPTRARNVEDDRKCVAQRIEAGINQHEHEQKRDRNSNQQSSRGLLRVFELAAPRYEISRRSFDLQGDCLLRVVHKTTDVAALDVAHDHRTPQRILTRDERIAAG